MCAFVSVCSNIYRNIPSERMQWSVNWKGKKNHDDNHYKLHWSDKCSVQRKRRKSIHTEIPQKITRSGFDDGCWWMVWTQSIKQLASVYYSLYVSHQSIIGCILNGNDWAKQFQSTNTFNRHNESPSSLSIDSCQLGGTHFVRARIYALIRYSPYSL